MLIVLTGPESCGKSTLANHVAKQLSLPLIREQSRDYLKDQPSYAPTDLLNIAGFQTNAEQSITSPSAVADTDLQVIYIWWQERFGPVPSALATAYRKQEQRHYLLCAPDITWQADSLRENPNDRDRLFVHYERDLKARSLPYDIVRGVGPARHQYALEAAQKALAGQP